LIRKPRKLGRPVYNVRTDLNADYSQKMRNRASIGLAICHPLTPSLQSFYQPAKATNIIQLTEINDFRTET
jgi:hypothetical protein